MTHSNALLHLDAVAWV